LRSGRRPYKDGLKSRSDGREGLKLRRIKVTLDVPTRHGDTELYLLSSVPEALADAATLARLYRQRWTIERAFLHLTVQLRCEVETLSYPPAVLFALACAMVVSNVLAIVKAALRAAHGAAVEARLSSHVMATHMRAMAESLETLVEPEDWRVFTRERAGAGAVAARSGAAGAAGALRQGAHAQVACQARHQATA
jgi:hypothetical protein